jgi:NTE family protein
MKPLYLALSGGGAHAGAHVGFLRGLDQAGIPVAGIAGVSGAALAAAAWAGGADLDSMIERAGNLHPWMWVRGWGGGLLSGSKLGAMIEEFLPTATFDGLRVPLWVLVTDLDTGEPVILKDGDLREAVRASCSFPGVFPPMTVRGRRFVSGEVSEVVPVRVARQMAGDDGLLVAVDCNAGARWPQASSFTAIAVRAGLTLVRGRTREDLLGADLVIAPKIGESGWMRPRRIPVFAEAGLAAAQETAEELRRLIAGEPFRPKVVRLPRSPAR